MAALTAFVQAQTDLRKLTADWPQCESSKPADTLEIHRHLTVCAHRHYIENISFYRRLAEEADLVDSQDADLIRREMLIGQSAFKSYPPAYLDRRDFVRMTRWLR